MDELPDELERVATELVDERHTIHYSIRTAMRAAMAWQRAADAKICSDLASKHATGSHPGHALGAQLCAIAIRTPAHGQRDEG